jgi:mono/diheme cytochrome c family protein
MYGSFKTAARTPKQAIMMWEAAMKQAEAKQERRDAMGAMTRSRKWQAECGPGAAVILFGAIAILASSPTLAADDFANGRRIFLEKADCAYCHGWAGDGAGQGQSPGGAANLRRSQLGRDQLIMVISCGIPGTAMPHFDDQAYTDKRCYGMTEAELGERTPNFPPSVPLPKREVEVVADYLLARIIGRGPITREECAENFAPRARFCDDYPSR